MRSCLLLRSVSRGGALFQKPPGFSKGAADITHFRYIDRWHDNWHSRGEGQSGFAQYSDRPGDPKTYDPCQEQRESQKGACLSNP